MPRNRDLGKIFGVLAAFIAFAFCLARCASVNAATCLPLPVCGAAAPPSNPPALIQSLGSDLSSTSAARLAFASPNAAGNSIAVAVRAGGHSGHVLNATDSNGNTYSNLKSVESGSSYTLAMFYAENVAAGTNTVTVADSTAAGPVRMVLREYSGVGHAKPPAIVATGSGTTITMSPSAVSGLLLSAVVTSASEASFTPTPAAAVEAVSGKLFVQHWATSALVPTSAAWVSLAMEFEAQSAPAPCETPTPVVTWDPVPDVDLAGYSIFYNETGGVPQKIRDLPCEMRDTNDDGIAETRVCLGPDLWLALQREGNFVPGTAYEFRVKAYDAEGHVSVNFSNVLNVCFRPLCVKPGPCN
jgi:hypothetical protein